MGAHTPVTALGAWNADATRLPARMHSEYLRRLYLRNDLAEGRYSAGGHWVTLGHMGEPLFVVGTERDHVSPWRSVYKIHGLVPVPVTFLLTTGGHNVGIVNAPDGPLVHPGAAYRVATHLRADAPANPQRWLEGTSPVSGSWWPCWHDWLVQHSSGTVPARTVTGLAEDGKPLLAPGTYVHQT
jgi:polyhydroxyalkanoate synthase subunit PhaC